MFRVSRLCQDCVARSTDWLLYTMQLDSLSYVCIIYVLGREGC